MTVLTSLVFGLSLSEIIKRDNNPSGLPTILEKTVQHVLKKGLEVPGILRQTISANRKKPLRKLFETGTVFTSLSYSHKHQDLHGLDLSSINIKEVAGVLKLFLRSLPEPLFSFELFQSLMSTADLPSVEEKVIAIRSVWKSIPPDNKRVVEHMFNFLQTICLASSKNEMNAMNLSVIFGPCFVRPKYETVDYMLQIPKVNKLIEFIIDNWARIVEVI